MVQNTQNHTGKKEKKNGIVTLDLETVEVTLERKTVAQEKRLNSIVALCSED